jgi:hypothetical protein
MFGKTGVVCDGAMFGMVTEDALYLRVDDHNRATAEVSFAGVVTQYFQFSHTSGNTLTQREYGIVAVSQRFRHRIATGQCSQKSERIGNGTPGEKTDKCTSIASLFFSVVKRD